MSEYDPWYHGPGTATAPPPPPPPPNPNPDVTVDPGYNPNYKDIIGRDPGYLAARNAAEYANKSAAAMRRQQLRDALIRYGGLPDGFKDQYGDFDKATLDLASGNQQSVLAQLKNNLGTSQHNLKGSLAARGMLQSGELNYGDDQLNQGYAQQRYDAGNVFSTQAANSLGEYTGVLNTSAFNLANAIAQAEATQSQNPAYRPRAAKVAKYNAGLSSQWGRPIYSYQNEDGSSSNYTATGSPFEPGNGGAWWA